MLCLVLPAAAAGQVTYAEDQTLVTTGAAELLYLVDADGDGDLDVWAGPKTAGGPIDLHEQAGPGAFTARALTVPTATYIHWTPCAANVDALMDVCYGDSGATRIHYVRALALGSLNATSTNVLTGSTNVSSLRPMKIAALTGDQFAYATVSLDVYAADPTASINNLPASLTSVLQVRTGDVNADGNDDLVLLRAADVQLSTNGGTLGLWNPALTFAIAGALDATVADLVAGAARELVVVTNSGTAFLVADATGAGTVSQLLGVQDAVAVTTLDADLDGDLDLAFAVRPLGVGAGIELWQNDGGGAFTLADAVSTAGGADVPVAIAAGDLVAADGKPELALALGGAARQVVIFASANLPPRITATGALPSPVPEGDPVTLSATASPPELGQALSYEFFDETGTSLGPPSASSSLVITAPRICGATLGATQLLTYRVDVSDGVASATSAPITLTVSEALNDPPIIDSFPLPGSINELATISVTAVAHDADCPVGPLTYTFTATGLTAVPVGSDRVDLTAADRICASGSAQVRVRVTDVLGAFVETADLPITINDTVDDPPVLGAITPAGPLAEGGLGTYTVALAQADDCPGQLAYAWTLPPELTIVSGQGTNQVQVAAGRICGDQAITLSVNASDAGNPAGLPATLALTLTEAINDPPVLDSFPLPASIDELARITVRAVGHDTDCPGDPVTYTFTATGLSSVPNGPDQVDLIATGRICAPGSAQVRVRVTDVLGSFFETADLPITINNVVDDVAELGAITAGGPLAEGAQRTLTVALAADDCPGQLVYNWILPPELTIVTGQGTNQVEVTAGRFCGDRTVTLAVNVADALNPAGAPATLPLDLAEAVNDPPVVDSFAPPAAPIAELGTGSMTVVASDPDCPGGPLTYVFSTGPRLTPVQNAALPSQVDLTAGRVCGPETSYVQVHVTDAHYGSVDSVPVPVQIAETRDDPPRPGAIVGESSLEELGASGLFTIALEQLDDCPARLGYTWIVPPELTIESGQGTDRLTVSGGQICATQDVELRVNAADAGNPQGVDSPPHVVTIVETTNEPPWIGPLLGPDLIPQGGSDRFNVSFGDPDCPDPSVLWSVFPVGELLFASPDNLPELSVAAPLLCRNGSATLRATVTDSQGATAILEQTVLTTWNNEAPFPTGDPPTVPDRLFESEPAPGAAFSVSARDDCGPLTYQWQATPDLLEFSESGGGQVTATIRQPLCGDATVDVSVDVSDGDLSTPFGPYRVPLFDDVPSSPEFGTATTSPERLLEHGPATVRIRVGDSACPVTEAAPSSLRCVATIPGVPVGDCVVQQELADEQLGHVVVDIPSLEGSCSSGLSFELPLAVSLSGPDATTQEDLFSLRVAAIDDPPAFAPVPPTAGARPETLPLLFDLTAPAVTDDGCSELVYAWSVLGPGRITLVASTGPAAVARNGLAPGAPDFLRCETTAQVEVSAADEVGSVTSSVLEFTVPSLDVRPPQNARFVETEPQSVGVASPLPLHARAEDDCPGKSFFRFTEESPLVSLEPDPDGFSVMVLAERCTAAGSAQIVATPTDGVHEGTRATIDIHVIAAPVTLQPPPPLLLALDGNPIDAAVVVDASCPTDLCFEQTGDQPALPLVDDEAGDPCGSPARRLRIPAEALSAFLPPHDRLTYEITEDEQGPAAPVTLNVQFLPSDDLLRLSHSTDRGRLGPGETATLTVEIASRLLGPIQVPVVIEDSLLGLSLVEGTARITGATLVEATATGGGAEFTVTNLPPAGSTATLTFLVTRSLASDGVVTSNVIARAVDLAPLSRRDGTAAAGLDLGAAPGIACSCASGGAEGGGWALLGLFLAALLAAPRTRLPRRPQTR